MEHYAVWAHQLFPRLKFGDFINAMEATTKKRSMRHYLDTELDKFFGYNIESEATAKEEKGPDEDAEADDIADTGVNMAALDDINFGNRFLCFRKQSSV